MYKICSECIESRNGVPRRSHILELGVSIDDSGIQLKLKNGHLEHGVIRQLWGIRLIIGRTYRSYS